MNGIAIPTDPGLDFEWSRKLVEAVISDFETWAGVRIEVGPWWSQFRSTGASVITARVRSRDALAGWAFEEWEAAVYVQICKSDLNVTIDAIGFRNERRVNSPGTMAQATARGGGSSLHWENNGWVLCEMEEWGYVQVPGDMFFFPKLAVRPFGAEFWISLGEYVCHPSQPPAASLQSSCGAWNSEAVVINSKFDEFRMNMVVRPPENALPAIVRIAPLSRELQHGLRDCFSLIAVIE